ncbi:hypothetical protein V2G26_007940 [Clonostachys chloroleuca]
MDASGPAGVAPDDAASSPVPGEPEVPSCQGCRRRKLKCSRDQPICAHCRRLDAPCVYDLKKNKPGIKAGAVGSLSRRVDALELALLKKGQDPAAFLSEDANTSSHENQQGGQGLVEILSTLASELHKLNSRATRGQTRGRDQRGSPTVSPTSHTSAFTSDRRDTNPYQDGSRRKRRRLDSCGNPNVDLVGPFEDELENITTSLPPPALLEEVINIYFDIIQPWIPILHETQFRSRVLNPEDLPHLIVILHAIVVAALRFVDDPAIKLSAEGVERQTAKSRNFVILTSMDSLSVESLQSLTIIAFNDIGNGDASKAWSIIGSLTRTVEYIQLSVEPDHHNKDPLLKPLPLIPRSKDWTEEEQRRRVFWNIFCLDRFCSVTTGWNTSLTSDDVKRRLPADGGLWHRQEAVMTPYFGIWDRSTARIGHSIAFLPGHYPTEDAVEDSPRTLSAAPPERNGSKSVDMTTVGAFAYCVEATESLSRITTYFLQQTIDFENRQEVSNWLTRFKELDLRLVHWKMFLPQRWRDSNISRQPALINMDPNLTLAHVTHNTSMILLHQRIAYPEPGRTEHVKLPSFCSAETCQIAAVETTTITKKYLKHTPEYSPVTNQFAFCVFISARVLLVHWRHYNTELLPEFWVLVDSLEEMARRWAGPILGHKASVSLAGKYASQLRMLHSRSEADPRLVIDVLGYSSGTVPGSTSSPFFNHDLPQNAGLADLRKQDPPRPESLSFSSQSHQGTNDQVGETDVPPAPGMPEQFQPPQPAQMQVQPLAGGQGQVQHMPRGGEFAMPDQAHPDRLSAISHMLMDEGFMAMDRIISLDDMIFTAQTPGANPMPWIAGQGPHLG